MYYFGHDCRMVAKGVSCNTAGLSQSGAIKYKKYDIECRNIYQALFGNLRWQFFSSNHSVQFSIQPYKKFSLLAWKNNISVFYSLIYNSCKVIYKVEIYVYLLEGQVRKFAVWKQL